MNFIPQKLPITYAFILSGGFDARTDVVKRVRHSQVEREYPSFGVDRVGVDNSNIK
jgi:hypothetical protein